MWGGNINNPSHYTLLGLNISKKTTSKDSIKNGGGGYTIDQ